MKPNDKAVTVKSEIALLKALESVERHLQQVQRSGIRNQEVREVQMLQELLKEQVESENSGHSARPTR